MNITEDLGIPMHKIELPSRLKYKEVDILNLIDGEVAKYSELESRNLEIYQHLFRNSLSIGHHILKQLNNTEIIHYYQFVFQQIVSKLDLQPDSAGYKNLLDEYKIRLEEMLSRTGVENFKLDLLRKFNDRHNSQTIRDKIDEILANIELEIEKILSSELKEDEKKIKLSQLIIQVRGLFNIELRKLITFEDYSYAQGKILEKKNRIDTI